MPERNVLSFRQQLRGMVGDVLDDVGMTCAETGKAVVDLIVELSHYTEEGVDLFPKVVVCDDKGLALSLVQGSEDQRIGEGPRTPKTARRALKQCAPLARRGWAVYLERTEGGFEYGVFRTPSSPTALDLMDSISGLDTDAARLFLLFQLARRSVGVVGPGAYFRQVRLSAVREDTASPFEASLQLATAIVADVPEETREPTGSFVRTALLEALQGGHGALVAVIPAGGSIPYALCNDAVILDAPLKILERIKAHKKNMSSETLAALLSCADLLSGMLHSDGITLVGSDASILGYNAFVKSRPQPEDTKPSETIGGARRRAFEVLKKLVNDGELAEAYFRSSDGHATCAKRET